MESGDKRVSVEAENYQLQSFPSQSNTPRSHLILNKLNIPKHCLDNQQIRQHYLEEYTAKYSKGKYLLSNARKKQRKIIMMYYEEKEKQIDFDRLQLIKQTLLEENQKIKRFKDALKEKLVIYQERIQFLKDPSCWSTVDIEQSSYNLPDSIQTDRDQYDQYNSQDSSTRLRHSQTFDENLESETLQNEITDDSFPVNPVLSDKTSVDTSHLQLDYLEPKPIPLITEEYYLSDNFEKYQQTLLVKKRSNMITTTRQSLPPSFWFSLMLRISNAIQRKRIAFLQWMKNYDSNSLKMFSMIYMIVLTILLVLLINDLLERCLQYLIQSKPMPKSVSPSKSLFFQFFHELLMNLHHWTIAWFYPL